MKRPSFLQGVGVALQAAAVRVAKDVGDLVRVRIAVPGEVGDRRVLALVEAVLARASRRAARLQAVRIDAGAEDR